MSGKMDDHAAYGGGRDGRPRRRRILLCVTRGRPRAVTRALYGLANLDEPWLPDEIAVITTQAGRERLIASLFGDGEFRQLCRQVGAANVSFRPANVRAITRSRSNRTPVETLDRAADERAAADFILQEIARITDDADTTLCVAINPEQDLAGVFVGQAMSLLARGRDRLVHVRAHADNATTARGPARCETVSVTEVPFMRMDRIVSMRLLARHADYTTMCTAFEDRADLEVRNAFRGIVFRFSRAFDIPCDSSHHVQDPRFEPRAAALYAYYAWRASEGLPFVADAELLHDPSQLLDMYDACLLGGASKIRDPDRPEQITRDALISARTRIARTLKTLIKDGAKYQAYRVQTCRDDRSYGLKLAPDQISFCDWVLPDPRAAVSRAAKGIARDRVR